MNSIIILAAFASVPADTDWRTAADYPEPAASQGKHGSAITSFEVTAEGRVENCRVIRSSGTAQLDEASCAIMTRRARFKPGVDAKGQPQTITTGITVHWIMPGQPQTSADLPIEGQSVRILYDPPLPRKTGEPALVGSGQARAVVRLAGAELPRYPREELKQGRQGRVAAVININRKGKPTGCSIIRTSGYAGLDQATCDFALRKIRFEPALDFYGKPVSSKDVFEMNWKF